MATVGSFGIATVKREINLKGTDKKLMKKNAVVLRRCDKKNGGAENAISTIIANVHDSCGFVARRPYATNKSGQNATNLRDFYGKTNNFTGGNAEQRKSGGNTTKNNVDISSGNATYYICGTYSLQATNLNPSVKPSMGKAINISNGNVTKNDNRLSGNAKTNSKNKNANESGNAFMADANLPPTRPYKRAAGGTTNTMQVCYRCMCDEIIVYFIKKGVG